MTRRIKFALLTLLAGGAMFLAPAARADQWNRQTLVTFNKPVQVPGRVLPAGTYIFQLADSEGDRRIVQIFTQDRKELLTTVATIPSYHRETGNALVTFEERATGSPEALHGWFYPGDLQGVLFVYPKAEK